MASTNDVVQVDVLRADAQRTTPGIDRVAAEAPLEVRLHGEPFSVIMRTPGTDHDLALGFLFTEGVVCGAGDVARVEDGDAPNIVNVTLTPARAALLPELLGQRRQVTMNSSCGMCGRRNLESLDVEGPPLAARWTVTAETILRLPDRLRDAQSAFAETGGLHAAGLFDTSGRLELSAEDVGRHNAVDKLLGRLLLAGRLPLEDLLLLVSGRSSFEIVQKAFLGGLPLIAAVSAPSSLAIELAQRAGITLLGFVRGDRFNLYTHPGRVVTTAG
ncbi:MAG: formate dehydrogenase accessory sulfurtransferase FdhD [Acidobacteria bacterium]|nr:formate dehydrogenase accessory sulfurtransferase FdhD [Acidobacteriota bacterium]